MTTDSRPLVSRARVARWFSLFRAHNRPAAQAGSLAKWFAENRRRQVPHTRGPLAA